MNKKRFYIIFSLLLIIPITLLIFKKEDNTLTKLEKNNMIGYTIDGVSSSTMPKKGSGYIVNSIICNNNSELVWDNDNWELEITKLEDFDFCTIDFTKDTSKSSSRVTLTSDTSLVNAVDSTSKTVTSNGTITFYMNDGYVLLSTSGCNATSNDNKIIINTVNSNITCSITIKQPYTLASAILRDNPTVSERTDFTGTYTENTTGTIFKTNKTEDGSTVYYYAGNTTNNWIYFGGFYWRIIRTNEDGSVRLLYAGTSHDTGSAYISKDQAFNDMNNSVVDVSYAYSKTNVSLIKKAIDKWYVNNLLSYENYISKDAIYCNDRSKSDQTTYSSDPNSYYFGGYGRTDKNKSPSYKCDDDMNNSVYPPFSSSLTNKDDMLNSSGNNGGNGQLKCITSGYTDKDCPIALMTVDEVVFAGGKHTTKLTSPYAWYYTNSNGVSITSGYDWWLLSPDVIRYTGSSVSRVSYIYKIDGYQNGQIRYNNSSDIYANLSYTSSARPVISLSSCAYVNGTGTPTDPYVVDESLSTCE